MTQLDAWTAAAQMTPGINIGNTLENTAKWETGWGNPPITKEYVESLARLGFKTRAPAGRLGHLCRRRRRSRREKFQRVAEVVDWITGAGHVLRRQHPLGWRLDRLGREGTFPEDATPPSAPKRSGSSDPTGSRSRRYFAGKNEKLIFEALNEETNFDKRRLHAEGLRDADAREPAVHRHGAQDRRQQRQAPADRHRLHHRHRRRPADSDVRAAEGHRPGQAAASPSTTTRRGSSSA